jgi:hypothetical protein
MTIQYENVSLCAERFDAGVLTDTCPLFSRAPFTYSVSVSTGVTDTEHLYSKHGKYTD